MCVAASPSSPAANWVTALSSHQELVVVTTGSVLKPVACAVTVHGHRIRTIDYESWIEAMLAYLADRPNHPFTPLTQLYTRRVTPDITIQEMTCARIEPKLDRSRLDAVCHRPTVSSFFPVSGLTWYFGLPRRVSSIPRTCTGR